MDIPVWSLLASTFLRRISDYFYIHEREITSASVCFLRFWYLKENLFNSFSNGMVNTLGVRNDKRKLTLSLLRFRKKRIRTTIQLASFFFFFLWQSHVSFFQIFSSFDSRKLLKFKCLWEHWRIFLVTKSIMVSRIRVFFLKLAAQFFSRHFIENLWTLGLSVGVSLNFRRLTPMFEVQ